jgi:hypothetical protein
MFYDILTVMPFLAIASCIALSVVIVVVCSSESLPRAAGFVVCERRKVGQSVRARTPVMQPTGGGAVLSYLCCTLEAAPIGRRHRAARR